MKYIAKLEFEFDAETKEDAENFVGEEILELIHLYEMPEHLNREVVVRNTLEKIGE